LYAAASTPEAILRSEFHFQQIAYRNTVSTLAGGAVALLLAVQGYGAIALAAQQLVQAALGAIWVWAVVDWRPSLAPRSSYEPEIARQGSSIMIASLLPQLIPRSFDLFVGLLLGPVALGIMRVANRFIDFVGQMITIPLTGVASAQFSVLADDVRAIRWSYLQMTQASAAIICPVIVGVGLVAPEAVPLLFGANWAASISIVQISSLLALAMPISYYFAPAMVAIGKRRALVRQSILDVGLGILAAIVAASISLEAVAIAMVIRAAFTCACNAYDLRVHINLSLLDLVRSLAPPYTATAIMVASVTAARFVLAPTHHSQLGTLLILASTGAFAFLATIGVGASLGIWPNYLVAIKRLVSRVFSSA
jgi:PST family polysaccharide transporter